MGLPGCANRSVLDPSIGAQNRSPPAFSAGQFQPPLYSHSARASGEDFKQLDHPYPFLVNCFRAAADLCHRPVTAIKSVDLLVISAVILASFGKPG